MKVNIMRKLNRKNKLDKIRTHFLLLLDKHMPLKKLKVKYSKIKEQNGSQPVSSDQ